MRSTWAAFGTLVFFLAAPPATAQDLANRDVQDRLTEAVQAILPDGWKITKTTVHVTPPDWHTSNPDSGFLVEGGNGKETFRIWFLPRDWIGIRKLENNAPHCYWEGILADNKLMTITASSDAKFPDRVHELFGRRLSTPSLVNGGFGQAMTIFEGRLDEVDETVEALIRKHCTTPQEFAEAAHSLIVLGVPAKRVFLRAARSVEGDGRDYFCTALGYFGGDDAIGVLCAIVADPRVPDARRQYAVMALLSHKDKRIGPALHTALKQMRDAEPIAAVAKGLVRQRYEAAGPDLLTAFHRIDNMHYKAEVAHALAGLRYQKAVPELERMLKELRTNGKTTPDELRDFELALLRLTGDWGQPDKQVRLLVLPPREPVVGQKMELIIYVENIGDEPLRVLARNDPGPGLLINGKARQETLSFGGIAYDLYPLEMRRMIYDLSGDITAPGRYTIQYTEGEARAAVITIDVKAAKP